VLRRLRTLGLRDWSLLLNAWVRLLIVDLELRVLGVERTARMARPSVGTDASRERIDRALLYASWLRRAAAYHPARARCLHRALALHQWLRGEGTPSSMDIGVARRGGALQAHAWVHVGGVLVGDSDNDVAPFATLQAAGGAPWR